MFRIGEATDLQSAAKRDTGVRVTNSMNESTVITVSISRKSLCKTGICVIWRCCKVILEAHKRR